MHRSSTSSPIVTTIFFAMCLVFAGLVWMFVVVPSQREVDSQEQRLHALRRSVREAEEERRRLSLLQEALGNDPQTIERALRKEGFAREGDRTMVVSQPDPTKK